MASSRPVPDAASRSSSAAATNSRWWVPSPPHVNSVPAEHVRSPRGTFRSARRAASDAAGTGRRSASSTGAYGQAPSTAAATPVPSPPSAALGQLACPFEQCRLSDPGRSRYEHGAAAAVTRVGQQIGRRLSLRAAADQVCLAGRGLLGDSAARIWSRTARAAGPVSPRVRGEVPRPCARTAAARHDGRPPRRAAHQRDIRLLVGGVLDKQPSHWPARRNTPE